MFISVEGVDYSGKTTMCGVIKEYFESRGREVVVSREPGGTVVGNQIRSILVNEDLQKEPLSIPTQILLFYASRMPHIERVIIPALKAGKVVISDRFMDSSLVYQGLMYGGSELISRLVGIPELKCMDIRPDYTIFYDIEYETMAARMNARGDSNTLDRKYSKLKQVPIECYKEHFYGLQSRMGDGIKIVDGNGTVEEVGIATKAICEEIANNPLWYLQGGGYLNNVQKKLKFNTFLKYDTRQENVDSVDTSMNSKLSSLSAGY